MMLTACTASFPENYPCRPKTLKKKLRQLGCSVNAVLPVVHKECADMKNASFMSVMLQNNRGSSKNQEAICAEDDFEERNVLKSQKAIAAV